MFCQKDLILLELRDLNLSKRGLRQNFGFGISGNILTLQCSKELALLSYTSRLSVIVDWLRKALEVFGLFGNFEAPDLEFFAHFPQFVL